MTTIVTRTTVGSNTGKGSPLTHTEVDTNFVNLNTAKLETAAIPLGTLQAPSVSFLNDSDTGIFCPQGGNSLAIATGGQYAITCTSTQAVGIQTANPNAALHVAGNARVGADDVTDAVLEIGAGASGNRTSYIDIVGDTTYTDYGLRIIRNNTGANATSELKHRGTGALNFTTEEAAPIVFNTTNSPALTILAGGNVGIGTSSPGEKLTVAGNISLSAAQPYLSVVDSVWGDACTFRSGVNTLGTAPGDYQLFNVPTGKGFAFAQNFATNSLVINSSGNVGIGSSNPQALLHISSATTATERISGTAGNSDNTECANIDFQNNTSGSVVGRIRSLTGVGGIQSGKGQLAFFAHNGTSLLERVRINEDGLVGIGSTVPNEKLTVADSGSANVYIALQNSTTGTTSADGWYLGAAGTEFQIYGKENGPITFSLNSSEKARIDTSGRLLVGTTTDTNNARLQEKLALVTIGSGNIGGMAITNYGGTSAGSRPLLDFQRSRGTTDESFTAVASGDQLGSIIFRGADGSQFVDAAFINCEVDGTPGANDMPGRLVFSTTPSSSASPTERARLSSTGEWLVYSSGNDTLVAGNAAGSGTAQSLFTGVHTRTSTTGGGTVAYRIYNNGTTFSISDARQKKNVETARDGYLEDLQQLRVVKYNWLDQADTESKELGLLAQEVAKVFPGLVQSADPSDPESTLGIKSSVFSFMLIKALQEAGEKIEALEARLSTLEIT
jgi:hypothetical protein